VAHGRHHHSANITLAATVPYHASQMFARNITSFLLHLVKDGKAAIESARRNHAGDAGDTRWRDCERAHKGNFSRCRRCRPRQPEEGPDATGSGDKLVRFPAGRVYRL